MERKSESKLPAWKRKNEGYTHSEEGKRGREVEK
jgi:hypothetical protein